MLNTQIAYPFLPLIHFCGSIVSFIALASCLWIISCLVRKNLVDEHGNPIPPGPLFRYAYLGQYPERALDRWAKRFGPLYSVWMGDQLFVVISDPHVAQDLLVENGAIFSSRMNYFIKNEVVLHHRALTASPYSPLWRHHRKLAMRFLSEKAVEGYTESIELEALALIRSLYVETKGGTSSINPALSAVRYTLNNMLTVSFGARTSSLYDPLLHQIQGWVMEFDDITGAFSNAVDFIPPLQHLPTRKRARGLKLNAEITEVYGGLIQDLQNRLDDLEYVPHCFVKTLLECRHEEKLETEDIIMLAVAFAFGGVHSIAGIIQWFLAFMATHPQVAAKAHEEMDRVVGRQRMPTVADEADMPYVHALIKEVQRIHAPFWVPTPHYSTADFVYNGMFIPKNTTVILNCWTIHHSEERYPDAFTFNPGRYMDHNLSCLASSKLRDPLKRDHWTFGAGRRLCPGLALAERELWLAISGLLWAYTFHQVAGEPISLEEHESLSGRTPLPFRMNLLPRHEGVQQILKAVDAAPCIFF